MAKDEIIEADPAPAAAPAPGGMRRIVQGAAWMIGARWAIRTIGLVNTIILARLLRPEDFGLVTMGAITVQFVMVFADSGQALAVIRNTAATAEHFDTAWTMSVVTGAVVAVVLIAIAPGAGWYFHEPRAVAVVQVVALKPLINGFTNVGILAFRKNLRFGKDFQFLVIQKISVFIAATTLAVLLRSYWALVIANLVSEVVNVIVSYRLSPYRPRLRLTKLKEIWSYSIWMQFANIGYFFGEQTDQILVGRLVGTTAMGAYNVSLDLGSAPTNEIVQPMARAVFPFYANLLAEPKRLAETYLGVLSTVALAALAAGVGVALVADDVVSVVLGAKWEGIGPLVAWLAVGSGILGIARTANQVLSVTGSGRLFALRNWLYVALLLPAAVAGGLLAGAKGVAEARLAVIVLFLPVVFFTVMRVLPITPRDILARLWRPAGAALAMSLVVELCGSAAIAEVPLRLLVNVTVGAASFALALLALWRLAGAPPGPERVVLDQLAKRLRGAAWPKSVFGR